MVFFQFVAYIPFELQDFMLAFVCFSFLELEFERNRGKILARSTWIVVCLKKILDWVPVQNFLLKLLKVI